MADAGGTVRAHAWESLNPADAYRIFQACFTSPPADDRLGLGALCHVLGLSADARREFGEAVRQDAGLRGSADQIPALALAQ